MDSKIRKGIVLAGGSGTRLYPATISVSKQLLPVYDKPMVYYPLSVLMLAGIKDVAIITTPHDKLQFQNLLGDGKQWGMSIEFIEQQRPEGLAQAYVLAEEFLDGQASTMILGDNIYYGHNFIDDVRSASAEGRGGTIFGYQVADPNRYGVVEFNSDGRVIGIEEKPADPKSNVAITGLYLLDGTAPTRAKDIKKSERGELEIISLLESYLEEGTLKLKSIGRGTAWLDTGTHASLLDAGNFVRTIQKRQGMQIGCLEEIALANGWISKEELKNTMQRYGENDYKIYLRGLC